MLAWLEDLASSDRYIFSDMTSVTVMASPSRLLAAAFGPSLWRDTGKTGLQVASSRTRRLPASRGRQRLDIRALLESTGKKNMRRRTCVQVDDETTRR